VFNYSIALSGLQLAQRAMDLIGTNVANATTPGYHRQELQVAAVELGRNASLSVAGVEVTGVQRAIDNLLEREMVRQQTRLGEADQNLSVLQTIESALGQIGSENLGTALNRFFKALNELPSQPDSRPLQEQVIWAAEGLAGQFRNLSGFLADTQHQIRLQAETMIQQVNSLAERIAQANVDIGASTTAGTTSNVVQDNRDQAINDLSELLRVDVTGDPTVAGVRNVSVMGLLLVLNGKSVPLEAGITSDGRLGISAQGADSWVTDVPGGRIGALVELANQTVPEIRGKLDALASDIISAINRLHVQGVGSAGSFSSLTGNGSPQGVLGDWAADVREGSFYIRVTDQATGQVSRHEIAVDPSVDTIASLSATLDALDHVSASVVNSALHVEADSGYRFDFLPAMTPQPYSSTLTGSALPAIAGVYTGQKNRVYAATVVGTGEVGLADGLSVVVRDEAGALVRTLNVGQGYAAGDSLEIIDGIRVSLSTGTLRDGETFGIQALADTDSSGFLSAAGMNTFFLGADASTIDVRPEIVEEPRLLATSLAPTMTDGANVQRMAAIGFQPGANLDGATPADFYQQMVTQVGQMVAALRASRKSLDGVMQQIVQQREAVSGVDVNEEAAKLLGFERMYQAMARYLSSLNKASSYLMEIV